MCIAVFFAGCAPKFEGQWQTCELEGLSVEMPYELKASPEMADEVSEQAGELIADMRTLVYEEGSVPVMMSVIYTEYIPELSGQLNLDGAAIGGVTGLQMRASQNGGKVFDTQAVEVETDGIAGRRMSGTVETQGKQICYRMWVYARDTRFWMVQAIWGDDVPTEAIDRIEQSIAFAPEVMETE